MFGVRGKRVVIGRPHRRLPLVKQSFRRVRSPFVSFVAGFDESPFMRSRFASYRLLLRTMLREDKSCTPRT
jgi:hypothetical protein